MFRLRIAAALAALLVASAACALPVTFQVRMGYMIDLGAFGPEDDFVDLAGTFNGWGSELTPLADPDEDTVYEVIVDGFSEGQEIEYKYRLNGLWDGTEEFPGYGNNRRYTVAEGENVVTVWYNDLAPPYGPVIAGFAPHPSSLRAGGTVLFEDLSAGAVTAWHWSFGGGDPASSIDPEPEVRYGTPGLFDVTLVVSDGAESDTLTVTDCIEVRELGLGELSWWNDTVFYEIFVRSFFDSDGDGIGDFEGLTAKLDYLNDGDPETGDDLGVTGIWLMPIHDSPSYHGYDAVDYHSIHPDYGTLQDFREFLDAAHARGIKVIMDLVLNHCSNEHPWFQASSAEDPFYRDFYTWSEDDPGQTGPWGQQVWHWNPSGWYYGLFTGSMPDLNYENPAVQDSMFDTAGWWLDEIGVDGFRLDAVLYIHEDGDQLQNCPATFQFWQDYNAHVKSVAPDCFSVGEAWTDTETVLDYVTDDRLDTCFEFDLSYSMVGAARDANAGWVAWKAQDAYDRYPYLQFCSFLSNHDQDRVLSQLSRDEARMKLAASLYLTLPGVPFLYYGEELGMTGTGDHLNIRRPMQWTGGANAGFTTGYPWNAVGDNYDDHNVAEELLDENSLLRWYQKLIDVREGAPALRRGEYLPLGCDEDTVFAFMRRHEGQILMVLANTASWGHGDFGVTLPEGALTPGGYGVANLLDEGDTLYLFVEGQRIENLSLAAHETAIYEILGESGIDPGDDELPAYRLGLGQNYPNPFNPETTITYTLPRRLPVSLRVFDAAGREQAVIRERVQDAGVHELHWAGDDESGRPLSSGVYLLRLDAGPESRVTKMVLIK